MLAHTGIVELDFSFFFLFPATMAEVRHHGEGFRGESFQPMHQAFILDPASG